MHIQNEISIDNFHAISHCAAIANGEKIRSHQDDRWLRAIGPSAYRSRYDPALGRLVTSWCEIRPNLIMLFGEAQPKANLTFPVRATQDISGVFIGANITLGDDRQKNGQLTGYADKPIMYPSVLNAGCETQLTISADSTAFFFGIFGTQSTLQSEFSIVNSMSRFIKETKEQQPSPILVEDHIISLILQMTRNPYHGEALNAYLVGKALEILSLSYHSADNAGRKTRSDLKKTPITFICSELSRAPATELVLQDFAQYLSISERALSRNFKNETGITFSSYQRMCRMELAAKKLASSKQSTIQISDEVGYKAITAFYRAFKMQYGMTPDEYRRIQFQ